MKESWACGVLLQTSRVPGQPELHSETLSHKQTEEVKNKTKQNETRFLFVLVKVAIVLIEHHDQSNSGRKRQRQMDLYECEASLVYIDKIALTPGKSYGIERSCLKRQTTSSTTKKCTLFCVYKCFACMCVWYTICMPGTQKAQNRVSDLLEL